MITIKDDKKFGIYTNGAAVHSSAVDLTVDFAYRLPQSDDAEIVVRVVMSPQTARSLLLALQSQVEEFEKRFGEVSLIERGVKTFS